AESECLQRKSTCGFYSALPFSLLMPIIKLVTLLIGAEGTRLLRDQRVGEDPAGACDEEASRTPRGKRVPAAEINLLDLHGTAVVSVKAHYKTGHFVD
ncbi:hypothetical protein, partial [Heyndrickxia acidicola]|nr:hypothetical protein [Heyndrickxia acidicola]